MDKKKYEQRALVVGIVCNILMGGAGLWVYYLTGIEALFLDAYFTLLAVFSGIIATLISMKSRYTSKSFPHGYFFLEPLYAIIKSLVTLGLLVFTTINAFNKAWKYFVHGVGEVINYGPVIPYEIIMVFFSMGLVFFYWIENKRTNNTSTMLNAEIKSTLIDGLMSAGIGVGILLMVVFTGGSLGPRFNFLLYTGDSFITLLLVGFSIKTPIKVIKSAFIELANGIVTNAEIKATVEAVVDCCLPADAEPVSCYIYKVGMSLKVSIYLKPQNGIIDWDMIQDKRTHIQNELSQMYENVTVNFVLS